MRNALAIGHPEWNDTCSAETSLRRPKPRSIRSRRGYQDGIVAPGPPIVKSAVRRTKSIASVKAKDSADWTWEDRTVDDMLRDCPGV